MTNLHGKWPSYFYKRGNLFNTYLGHSEPRTRPSERRRAPTKQKRIKRLLAKDQAAQRDQGPLATDKAPDDVHLGDRHAVSLRLVVARSSEARRGGRRCPPARGSRSLPSPVFLRRTRGRHGAHPGAARRHLAVARGGPRGRERTAGDGRDCPGGGEGLLRAGGDDPGGVEEGELTRG